MRWSIHHALTQSTGAGDNRLAAQFGPCYDHLVADVVEDFAAIVHDRKGEEPNTPRDAQAVAVRGMSRSYFGVAWRFP